MLKTKNKPKVKYKLKTGDEVKVISGNYKGKIGKITSIVTSKGRAIVTGINEVKKHVKPSAKNPRGGIISMLSSIDMSNLMLIDQSTKTPTRVGRKLNDKNKLQRYSKKSDKFI